MSKLATAAKAPFIISHGGREYRLAPLELADLAEFEQWMTIAPYEAAKRQMEALGDSLTPEARTMILTTAQAKAADCSMSSPEYMRTMSSVQGTCYMLWLSLRKEHPDITRAEAGALINLDNLAEWQERLDRVSGLSGDDEENPTGSPAPESVVQRIGEAFSE